MKTQSRKAAVGVKRTPGEKLRYVRKNWQLYLIFLLPALALTIIFKYFPMEAY